MASTPHPTVELLERWAVEAGFDRAGIAALEPSRHGPTLRRWLARGEHAFSPWVMGLPFGVGQLLAGAVLYWTLERNDGCG